MAGKPISWKMAALLFVTMMVAEFGSTGAEAIFVFHRLEEGNGT